MDTTLAAVARESRGKNEARRLRVTGQIPAVVYGGSQDPQAVAVSPKELSRLLHSESGLNTLIDLKVAGATTKVIVKAYLLQPVTHQLLHADFYRVDLTRKVHVKVAVRLHGEPRGVKVQGGVLDFVHREIEVETLPAEIPEHIDIDVSGMMIGDGRCTACAALESSFCAPTRETTSAVAVTPQTMCTRLSLSPIARAPERSACPNEGGRTPIAARLPTKR